MHDPNAILVDLTEFATAPLRTGIQRVGFEIISRWPGSRPLVPFYVVDEHRARILPATTFEAMTRYFTGRGRRLRILAGRMRHLCGNAWRTIGLDDISRYAAVFTSELFADWTRCEFYHHLLDRMPEQVFLVAHDFIPWLQPDVFPKGHAQGAMPWIRMLRRSRNIAFFSDHTRQAFVRHVARHHAIDGPVIPLGCDGLGAEVPRFDPDHRLFTVLGTLEPRKNLNLILDAFEQLWADGVHAELCFIGRVGWLPHDQQQRIRHLHHSDTPFEHHAGLKDHDVREILRRSRATIYASSVEGFGLPPVESLSLGVPVIVADHIPSIQALPANGQIRLDTITASSIRNAVETMLDDTTATQVYSDLAGLRLPAWDDLAAGVAAWIDRTVAAPPEK